MRENEVWQIVKTGLEGQQVLCQRIESAQTNAGIWDVNCTWAGLEFWLELKANRSPLRPAQKAWGVAKAKAGARMSIISMEIPGSLEIWSVWTGIVKEQYPKNPDKVFPTDQWYAIRQYLTMAP